MTADEFPLKEAIQQVFKNDKQIALVTYYKKNGEMVTIDLSKSGKGIFSSHN